MYTPARFETIIPTIFLPSLCCSASGAETLQPGLFPVLLILSRLIPPVIKDQPTSLNISAFVPHVIKYVRTHAMFPQVRTHPYSVTKICLKPKLVHYDTLCIQVRTQSRTQDTSDGGQSAESTRDQ